MKESNSKLNKKSISKKRSILSTLIYIPSELVQLVLQTIAMGAYVGANFFVCMNLLDKNLFCTMEILVLETSGVVIAYIVFELILLLISYLKAVDGYRRLPLTIEELTKANITSIEDYWNIIVNFTKYINNLAYNEINYYSNQRFDNQIAKDITEYFTKTVPISSEEFEDIVSNKFEGEVEDSCLCIQIRDKMKDYFEFEDKNKTKEEND